MVDKVYDQFDAATRDLSAFVVLRKGTSDVAAKVVIKRGNQRCYAYVHIFGTRMVRGVASGGGYDMASAAVEDAARKYATNAKRAAGESEFVRESYADPVAVTLSRAMLDSGGQSWNRKVEEWCSGLPDVPHFDVIQVH